MEGMAGRRVYRKNTVKGSRKGQKWPEQTRTAALCDLLVGNNICAVARRYGVPESTLRSWMAAARKTGRKGEQSLFDAARAEQLRALGHLAAAGARASVEYAQRRLEIGARDAELCEEIQRRLDADDGLCGEEGPDGAGAMDADERLKLRLAMERHRPITDLAAANYIRTLTGTAGRAAEIIQADRERQEGPEAGRMAFVLDGTLDELGG